MLKKIIFLLVLLISLVIPSTAFAQVHTRPTTTATLSPNPTTPGSNFSYYSDPVTVTLDATADTGYTVANTYYKIDNGQQVTYSAPFTVSGSGTHSIEFWSVDNTGLEEFPHSSRTFIVSPQEGVINSITQDTESGTTLNITANFENFEEYTNQLFNNDCYNDSGRVVSIFNAVTGQRITSMNHDQGGRCYSLGNPYQTLVFSSVQLPTGTYFIHYHGGTNHDWITDTYYYKGPHVFLSCP